MSNRPSLDEYIDVAERIQDFKDKHPEGSLQTLGWEVVTVKGIDAKTHKETERTFVVYRAAAYRTPDDPTPGHGIAWEPFPGGTPYTKDSELMNAETAAWGRAIVAVGLVANRSLASRQEVRNRRADQEAASEAPQEPATATPSTTSTTDPGDEIVNAQTLKQLRATFEASPVTDAELPWHLLSCGVESLPENPTPQDIARVMRGLTVAQASRLEASLRGEDDSVPGSGEAA